ncbi:MAG TPA: hypothetical protein IAB67_01145 [Candidatus Ventrousia excrementavium]|uniref:Uncharacterized protein n=1 Tax=Candidatus Ventrousia excrementavium TaxID=2840961 RepID=A0A9D1IVQ2_9CLOT|nr:hypothetical protein [Candidatus Ventrousia excrementavium]
MKEKKEAKAQKVQKAQDIITNRVLIFFGFTAIFLWVISYLNRAFDYPSSFQAANVAAVIMMVVGAAAVVAGLVWQRARVRSGKAQDAALSGYVVVWFGLVLALSCAMMMFYSYTLAMRLLYVLMPVSAVLYLIYYVYPREFFTVCLTHASLAFLMWALAKTSDAGGDPVIRYGSFVLAVLVCAAALALAYKTRSTGGVLTLGSRQIAVFNKTTNIRYVTILYAATLVLLVAALLLGAPFAFYVLYADLAFIAVAAVYYTVRML